MHWVTYPTKSSNAMLKIITKKKSTELYRGPCQSGTLRTRADHRTIREKPLRLIFYTHTC